MNIVTFLDEHLKLLKQKTFSVGDRDSFDRADDLYSLLWRLRNGEKIVEIDELLKQLEASSSCPSIFDDEHECESIKYNKDECINCWQKYIENYMQKDGIK